MKNETAGKDETARMGETAMKGETAGKDETAGNDSWVLYFSGIPMARLWPEKRGLEGSLLDPCTLEWGPVHPLSKGERALLQKITRMDLLRALGRMMSLEEGPGKKDGVPPAEGRGRPDGIRREQGIKYPANLLFKGGRVLAALTPSREGMAVLVRPGEEDQTPLALWGERNREPLCSVEALGTFETPTRDGERLCTDLYLPRERTGPVPALLVRTPYGRRDGAEGWFRFVHRGYAVAVQDVRGKGDSTGEWIPHCHEVEDGTDTLEWMAAKDWCDGNIGMMGGSYLGYVQWAAAAGGSPHLKAMISLVPSGSAFVDQPRRGGCCASGMLPWSFSVSPQRYDPSLMERPDWDEVLKIRPLKELPERALGYRVPFWEEYLRHRDYDEFWRRGNWAERFPEQGRPVPVLLQSGWFDDDGMGTTEALDLTRDWPCRRVVLGPWQHSGNSRYELGGLSFGEDALRYDLDFLHLRWLDRFLMGRENGVEREAPVEYYTTGEERWHTASSWPPSPREERTLWLGGGDARTGLGEGLLLEEPPKRPGKSLCRYDPASPAPNLLDLEENELALPEDYSREEGRGDYLCYTTPPFQQGVVVTGDCRMALYLVSDGEDADVVARLCDVDQKGRSVKVADAVLGARYRLGYDSPAPLPPGEPVCLTLRSTKLSHRFAPGHRLRLSVTFSAEGLILPNSGTGAGFDSAVTRVCQNGICTGGDTPSRILLPWREEAPEESGGGNGEKNP